MIDRRVFVIVLDSFGCGNAPDAKDFGDEGSNTLKTITGSREYNTPNMKKMGMFNIDGNDYVSGCEKAIGAFGRLTEQSRGKDTTIVHCIVLGIIISVGAVCGDLVESLWKRYFDVKDSGNMIPGHGGILDRFDSALVAIPLACIYLSIFGLL